jgi:polyhydroxybutyrate depolymerase
MMRRVLKWVALVLSGIAVLAIAAYAYYWYSPPPQVPTLSSAIQRATLRVGNRDRTYLAYAPARLSKGAPLVVVLHGSVMDGEMMRKWTGYEFDQWADRKGFVVVYPHGAVLTRFRRPTCPAQRHHDSTSGHSVTASP